jgi:hypothetical protein
MQEMQLNSSRRWTSATVLIAMLGLAGCASGYSAANPPSAISQPPRNNFASIGLQVTPYAYNADFDTGSIGPVAAPAAGVWGTATPQIATPGGPTISGSAGPYPSPNTSFPVLATGLQFAGGGGVSPISAGKDATATVTQSAVYDPCVGIGVTSLQLAIPSANVNTTIYVGLGGNTADANGNPDPLNYIALGNWTVRSSGPGGPFFFYLFGYETPISAVPTSGQASFSGRVSGDVFAPIDGHVMQAGLSGNANVTADFASGNVTGALTGLQYHEGGTSNGGLVQGPWNDVSLTAAIASGSNRFSGTTTATSAPSTPFSLSGSAAGHIDGAFFGPSAQAVGAVWTLSDGAAAAIGTIAARR